jgi:hypothetical protein
LQFFRLKPYKTAEFKVAVPKTEVLEQPQLTIRSEQLGMSSEQLAMRSEE